MKKISIVYLYIPVFLLISFLAQAQTIDTTRLRGMMVKTEIDEAGLHTLANWGANHIRWQLTWDGFPHSQADNADSNAYKKSAACNDVQNALELISISFKSLHKH